MIKIHLHYQLYSISVKGKVLVKGKILANVPLCVSKHFDSAKGG